MELHCPHVVVGRISERPPPVRDWRLLRLLYLRRRVSLRRRLFLLDFIPSIQVKRMILSTLDFFETDKYKVGGLVTATHVEAISAFRSFFAELRGAFGNKSEMLTKKLQDAHNGAFATLIENTQARYPNAVGVVGIRTELGEISNMEGGPGFLTVIVTGTAIVPKMGGGSRRRRRRIVRHRKTRRAAFIA